MTTTPVPASGGLLLSRARARVDARDSGDALRRVTEKVGNMLQVRNLALLLGAGSSMHLGAPRIRSLSSDQVKAMLIAATQELTEPESALLNAIIAGANTDLEEVLGTLTMSIAFAERWELTKVDIKGTEHETETFRGLRRALNRALTKACDLSSLEMPKSGPGPWLGHRNFFSKILAARRGGLPRIDVFTTNYDLAIETSLDGLGVQYIDGFAGSVVQTFNPAAFNQDFYAHEESGPRELVRVPDVVRLYKLHGSINWRFGPDPSSQDREVLLRVSREDLSAGQELAVIYPTPQKDSDTLGYPYSDLLHAFASVLSRADTALLVVGYGFADDHINRMIFQALAGNPTLQLMVLSPHGTYSLQGVERVDGIEEKPEAFWGSNPASHLARVPDARISVLAGPFASFVEFSEHVLPDTGDSDDAQQTIAAELSRILLGRPRADSETKITS